ncbi:DUF1697 domain-containing protein [Ancrocorticia populi]|uniref:Pyridoxamine 5-phosphate oxidase n=1 Tax=Ancrocorticia populi TaxID=2175228 RepID=A0A2V1K4J0_9ACTO|nr:DUF1697 domain-containing protein [Ancrocorticia populi]PWF24467.1 pyridoxamine 5-phosphate oxidase [Ancrocorticia populi]
MNRWVALLRGVNVNGITLRSGELAQLFSDLGFSNVRTVLASGNVCFDSEVSPGVPEQARLKLAIETGLRERFGYEAWIVLIEQNGLTEIIQSYPFEEDAQHHAYVVFASSDESRDELVEAASAQENGAVEQVGVGKGVVYWRCPKGESTSTPFAKIVAKARFKATTTNRNLNTLRKLENA